MTDRRAVGGRGATRGADAPSESDLVERLRRLLLEDLGVRPAVDRVGPDTPLLRGGADLDSFAIIEFVCLVESEFGIRFPEADLRPETFRDLRSVAAAVGALLRRGSSGGPAR